MSEQVDKMKQLLGALRNPLYPPSRIVAQELVQQIKQLRVDLEKNFGMSKAQSERIQIELKEALVVYRENVSMAQRLELIDSSRSSALKKNLALIQSKQVTDVLKRTSKLIAADVKRTSEAFNALNASTETLRTTHSGLHDLSALAGISSKTIQEIRQREKMARLKIWLALAFFYAVIAYIASVRLGIIRFIFGSSSRSAPTQENHDEL